MCLNNVNNVLHIQQSYNNKINTYKNCNKKYYNKKSKYRCYNVKNKFKLMRQINNIDHAEFLH